MKNNPTIVIPNWNGRDILADCLRSLETQTMPHRVIVVDNGSTDDSVQLVHDKFPQVQLLSFADNAGFAGGVNRGIQPALEQGADYVVLFNNDAVAAPDWLESLVRTAEAQPKVGIVTSKIRHYDDNRLDSTGDFYSVWGFPFPRGRGEMDHGQYDGDGNREIFAGSGGASLYRATMLRQIGLFDERFFAYYEDVDISFRAQLAGWEVLYQPAAVVRHRIGVTSRRANASGSATDQLVTAEAGAPSPFARYHSVKNFVYLYTKNMPGWLYWKYLPRFWGSWAMMLASDAKRGMLRSNLRANVIALKHLPSILRDRRHIQRARKISVRQLDAMLYHALPPQQLLRFRRLRKRHSAK